MAISGRWPNIDFLSLSLSLSCSIVRLVSSTSRLDVFAIIERRHQRQRLLLVVLGSHCIHVNWFVYLGKCARKWKRQILVGGDCFFFFVNALLSSLPALLV